MRVCTECGGPAEYRADEGVWRHAGQPYENGFIAQMFCDRYGYPIETAEEKEAA